MAPLGEGGGGPTDPFGSGLVSDPDAYLSGALDPGEEGRVPLSAMVGEGESSPEATGAAVLLNGTAGAGAEDSAGEQRRSSFRSGITAPPSRQDLDPTPPSSSSDVLMMNTGGIQETTGRGKGSIAPRAIPPSGIPSVDRTIRIREILLRKRREVSPT